MYLVEFSTNDGDYWNEMFNTEEEVIHCKNQQCIKRILQVTKEVTMQQVQETRDKLLTVPNDIRFYI